MLRRLQRSASQPAGSENRPKAKNDAVPSAISSRIGLAVDRLEPDHHGREDQHHVVVDRVREIVEADGQAAALVLVRGQRAEIRHRIPWNRSPEQPVALIYAIVADEPIRIPTACSASLARSRKPSAAIGFAVPRPSTLQPARDYHFAGARHGATAAPGASMRRVGGVAAATAAALSVLVASAWAGGEPPRRDEPRFLLFSTTDLWRHGGFAAWRRGLVARRRRPAKASRSR